MNDIEPILIDAGEVTGPAGQNINSADFINDGMIASSLGDVSADGEYSDEEDFSTNNESLSV